MNQTVRRFVELVARAHSEGPVIEFGSRQVHGQEAISDLRNLFRGPYTGCDVLLGTGVDVAADCIWPPFETETFKTVVCCEMLEHCRKPWVAIEKLVGLLHRDGVLIVATPFMLGIHHLPDYWRFTPEGMEALLDDAPYSAVYFRGHMALPVDVMAIAAKSKEVFNRVTAEVENHFWELPAEFEGEQIYRWNGQDDYLALRQTDPGYGKTMMFSVWTQ